MGCVHIPYKPQRLLFSDLVLHNAIPLGGLGCIYMLSCSPSASPSHGRLPAGKIPEV